MMGIGYLCISLDFELMWGSKGHSTIETYGENVAGVRNAIPQMLDLFQSYGIHATWAIVGLMLAQNKQEMIAYAPDLKPQYQHTDLSSYQYLDEVGPNEDQDIYHYGQSLAKLICGCPGQEIGSHTYSHFYALENGSSKEAFAADLAASRKIIRDKLGKEVTSFVYPRNQCNPDYESALTDNGFTAYRGHEANWIYNGPTRLCKKFFRLVDTYVDLTGPKCTSLEDIVQDQIVNLPSSRFFRPFMPRLAQLEPLKVQRIIKQMQYAAQYGKIFHMWWHPHNVGIRTDIHIAQLREIFEQYQTLSGQYGFKCLNMGELSSLALGRDNRS